MIFNTWAVASSNNEAGGELGSTKSGEYFFGQHPWAPII
jgi:hypothetical protein